MRLFKTSIFLFVAITMVVGTGTVLSQGSEPAAEPSPTPTPSGQPVKTLVIVTAPAAAVAVSQVPATAPSDPSAPSSGMFYNPPAPKSYTPGNYQTPSQVSTAYSNTPQPNMLNYAAVPNAAPSAMKRSMAPANSTQPATSSSSTISSPLSNPAPSSATATINIPTDGNVSTGVTVVGSHAFGFADVTQYTSPPGSTTGFIDVSITVTN